MPDVANAGRIFNMGVKGGIGTVPFENVFGKAVMVVFAAGFITRFYMLAYGQYGNAVVFFLIVFIIINDKHGVVFPRSTDVFFKLAFQPVVTP